MTVTGSRTAAGESDNVPGDAKIVNAAGEDVTASYAITYESGTLKVTRAAPTVIAPKAGEDLAYDGTAQALVTPGQVDGGTMQYALGADAAMVPGSGWSESVPTGIEAGIYYVWYRAVGDANHTDTDPACVAATMLKVVEPEPLDPDALVYNGKPQELLKPGSATGGTMVYAVTTTEAEPEEDDYQTTVPTATDAGTYYAWYKVVPDPNHNPAGPFSITVDIARRPLTVTAG